jgi:hypothetical protein
MKITPLKNELPKLRNIFSNKNPENILPKAKILKGATNSIGASWVFWKKLLKIFIGPKKARYINLQEYKAVKNADNTPNQYAKWPKGVYDA